MKALQNQLNQFFGVENTAEKRETNNARARCKRLAARLGVRIEIERDACGNGYWLHNTGRDDENFCTSWAEVEEKLKSL